MKSLKEKFDELAQRLYQEHERRVQPKYPWILVRVLPREHQKGSIILTEKQQKIVEEGVVLETWPSFWSMEERKRIDGEFFTVRRKIECDVAVGDHVLFPHYEGMPVGALLDEKQYRFVRTSNYQDARCEVMGKWEYDPEPVAAKLADVIGQGTTVEDLLDQFYVIPKDMNARTISGV